MKLIYTSKSNITSEVSEGTNGTTSTGKRSATLRALEIVFLLVAIFSTAALFAQDGKTSSMMVLKHQNADMSTIKNIEVYPETGTTTIAWAVSTEPSACIWVIEKSADGELFIPFAKVIGTVTEGERTYKYVDTKPLAGPEYYRIIKIMNSGAYNYTSIYSVNELNVEMAAGSPAVSEPGSSPIKSGPATGTNR